jgi:AhpD family alkylhydroperoxidase
MRIEKKLMRISPKPPHTYPWYLRPFFWNQRRKYGAVLDSARLWGRAPKLFLGVAFLYGMIDRRDSPLPPVLRSLITVRVSQLNGCRFCVDINSATLLKRGVAVGKVQALDAWQQSDLFSESERVSLEYAEAVTLRSHAIEERLMERLKEHFKDDTIIELTALIAFQNLSSKFNSALGVPPQGFCRIPTREK